MPPAVAAEIKSFPLPEWVRVTRVPSDLQQLPVVEALGPGETEAMRLALHLSPDRLLMDEAQGRRLAKALHLKVTEVLGVLISARELGFDPIDSPGAEFADLQRFSRFRLVI